MYVNVWCQVGIVFGFEGIFFIWFVVICDFYEFFVCSVCDSYGYERVVIDWYDIVDVDDIDVVLVVVLNVLYCQVVEDLVWVGKYVLCEKLLFDSLENVRVMVELEVNFQVVIGVGFSY